MLKVYCWIYAHTNGYIHIQTINSFIIAIHCSIVWVKLAQKKNKSAHLRMQMLELLEK